MTSLIEAIAEARGVQLEEDGMGVGVQVGDGDGAGFVQWTAALDAPLVLERVEIQPANSGADAELTSRGFQIGPEFGLLVKDVSQTFSTEDEFIAYIAELLRLIGAADGMKLITFP